MTPKPLRRFIALSHALGWMEDASLPFLQATLGPAAIQTSEEAICIDASLDAKTLEIALEQAAIKMRDAGWITGWRKERYTVFANDAAGSLDLGQPLFTLERAAFRRFGLTSRAVHINGYTTKGELWIAQRASNKAIDPDKLDNLAAGGISAGENIWDCVIRELAEEAGIPAQLASQAVSSGSLRTTRSEADGWHDEIIYTYDLQLPDDFVPKNTDGEVAGFQRCSFEQIEAILPRMTLDAAVVTQAFLAQQTRR
ncbi:NUDIX domain-containing protein [Iodobacter arcticus]|uniref:NUDIX domain-containing protein n=1 Tax=Iodobacter arcticus TaxID=590593 RepID=A0ABW2R009_9NEIS